MAHINNMAIKTNDIINGYAIIRKIGEGGMGEVWLAKHQASRQFFAAKFLSSLLARDKDRDRFRREMEILKSLDHPSVTKIYDVIDTKDLLGYVMEYCPDGDLDSHATKYPKNDLLPYMEQLADAVKFLHSKNFIHRDIKPTNLLIAQDGILRLSDFGLAASSDPGRTVITSSNWTSAGFSAPEQYIDMASVTHKADYYSIGAVLYYLLKRKAFNFAGDTESQLADLNTINRSILRGLLQRDPAIRVGDLAIFQSGLKALQEKGVKDYFESPSAERLAMLNAKYHDCTNCPETVDKCDDMEILDFLPFLKLIQAYEEDSSLKTKISAMHSDLSAAMESIIEDMKQTNP
jgi:serine/threonine protein kinase